VFFKSKLAGQSCRFTHFNRILAKENEENGGSLFPLFASVKNFQPQKIKAERQLRPTDLRDSFSLELF
jgi:hypothetical protein